MRGADEFITYISRWDIGSTGAHVKVAGIPGTGFASVAQTATGKYTVTFSRGLPVGKLVEFTATQAAAVDEEPKVARATVAGYVPETAGAAATMLYESWDIDETAAQIDWPSTSEVTLRAVFLKGL